MYIFWIILAIAFVIIEFGTVALISVWFVGGSLAAMAAALVGGPLWLQVLLFALVSLILLLLLRPFLHRFIDPHKTRTNVDAVIGQQALVTEDIDNLNGTGAIKLGGTVWTARSSASGSRRAPWSSWNPFRASKPWSSPSPSPHPERSQNPDP